MTPSLTEVLRLALAAGSQDVHTALPGTVTAYDRAKQRADVRPDLRRLVPSVDSDGVDVAEDLPVVPFVKVLFPQANDCIIHLPVKKGTTGLLIFLEADPSSWFRTGGLVTPGDQRTHSIAHAVFYPGLVPNQQVVSGLDGDALTLKNGDNDIKVKESVTEIGGNSDAPGLASWIDEQFTKVAQAFATFVPGTGGANFPNPYIKSGSSASQKVKLGG